MDDVVTDDAGNAALNKAKQESAERRAVAVEELIEEVKADAQAEKPLKAEKDAVPFLMGRGLNRKEARALIKDKDGVAWRIETLLNEPGKPKVLLPIAYTPGEVSKETAEINQDPKNPISTGV